jgi:hypothetical protein
MVRRAEILIASCLHYELWFGCRRVATLVEVPEKVNKSWAWYYILERPTIWMYYSNKKKTATSVLMFHIASAIMHRSICMLLNHCCARDIRNTSNVLCGGCTDNDMSNRRLSLIDVQLQPRATSFRTLNSRRNRTASSPQGNASLLLFVYSELTDRKIVNYYCQPILLQLELHVFFFQVFSSLPVRGKSMHSREKWSTFFKQKLATFVH